MDGGADTAGLVGEAARIIHCRSTVSSARRRRVMQPILFSDDPQFWYETQRIPG
jgi:hypothetical protein